uniref:Uncharacterized protein n=1 Tax=Ditylenchus dipsaci TaxID=166011 RepID=A0A915EA93_9BILA
MTTRAYFQSNHGIKLFSSVLLLLCTTQALVSTNNDRNDALDTVEKMCSYFKDVTDPTVDIVGKMSKVAEKIAPFAKVVFPVGTLIAGSLNMQAESPEYEAIKKLGKEMKFEFFKVQSAIDYNFKVISLENKFGDYSNYVEGKLDNLESESEVMWDPAIKKTPEVVNVFKHNCLNNNPKEILMTIARYVVKDCPELFEQIVKYNVKNVHYASEYQQRQFEEEKLDVITTLMANPEEADSLIEGIKWKFTSKASSLKEALTRVKSSLKENNIEVQATHCLADAMLFAGNCANLTYGGQAAAINKYQSDCVKEMQKILSFVSLFVEKRMKYAWPKAYQSAARKVVGNEELSSKLFNETSIKIAAQMDKIGLPIYYYQIVVATYEQERFLKTELYRVAGAQRWYSQKKDKIYQIIDYNYNIGRLDDLVQKIEDGIGESLTSDMLYRSIAVTRDYSKVQGGCKVNFGRVATTAYDGSGSPIADAAEYIDYYWKGEPIFKNCEEYVLFLFL